MKNIITLFFYSLLITNTSFAQDILFYRDDFNEYLLTYDGIKHAYQCGKGKIKKITYHISQERNSLWYQEIILLFDKEGNLTKRKSRTIFPDKQEKKEIIEKQYQGNYIDIGNTHFQHDYHYNQNKKVSQIDTYLAMNINETPHYRKLKITYNKDNNILQKIGIYEDEKNNSIFPYQSFSYKYRNNDKLDSITFIYNSFNPRIYTKDEKKKKDNVTTHQLDTTTLKVTAKYVYNAENKLQNIIIYQYFSGKSHKEIYEMLPIKKRDKGQYALKSNNHIIAFDKEDNWTFMIELNDDFMDTVISRRIEYYK